MRYIADFHIHSRYSRATSKNMNIPSLAHWAKIKGVGLMGTGDFTHPVWFAELRKTLSVDARNGLYTHQDVYFILSGEISSIYSQNGKCYRVHNIVMVPDFKIAAAVNTMLAKFGNIASDGRPIIGISCIRLAQELFAISEDIMLVPAHIWTPWFSVFGSKSGFDRLEDCYGEYTSRIAALETGLSSDPAMNWRLSQLDAFSLISNSDAHSPSRIGREANVFDSALNYWEILRILRAKDTKKFIQTIEFFPEEGKYHFDGHRMCHVRFDPQETKKHNGMCPVCKKQLTRGVMYRVEQLADRPIGFVPEKTVGYTSLVPLDEIIAEAQGVSKTTKAVERIYMDYIRQCGPELDIMLGDNEAMLGKLDSRVAQGIRNVRQKKVMTLAGYDGEYGIIKVLAEQGRFGAAEALPGKEKQMTLF